MIELNFNEEQKNVLKAAGVEMLESAVYTEDEVDDMDGKIKDYLLYTGYDKDYNYKNGGQIARQIIRYLDQKTS